MRLAAALLAMLWAAGAGAAPLDAPACAALGAERDGLVTAGAEAVRQRGPDWARANADAATLRQVARLIAVDEQLRFRCQPAPAGGLGGDLAIPALDAIAAPAVPLPERSPVARQARPPVAPAAGGGP